MSDFSKEVRENYNAALDADRENREEMVTDLEFEAGRQWDERVREYREDADREFPLPCLTINTIPQFLGQVIGDRMANQTSIKVLPREDGDKNVAEVRTELIRSIEHHSKAQRVYAQSFGQAVSCGMGNFRIDLDYAYEDVFDRDLFIRGIPNPLSVLWDGHSADPTGRDADYCFAVDKMKLEDYKKEYPKAAPPAMFDSELKRADWCSDHHVRVAEYWRIEEKDRTIAMFKDGTVQDITDRKDEEVKPLLWLKPDGQPLVRNAPCRYAVRYMTNGQEELDDPLRLKIPRLPIIRVMGREVWIGDERVRYGLTRFARDPQCLKNYWRSVVAELLMGAPRANYMARQSAIKGREDDWPNTLVFNDDAEMPQAITTQNLSAFINEAAMCAQDMKDVTGLHDASLGMRGNETSGVAIQRRQNEGDIATIGYHENMNAAMQEAGEVLNALIPIVYDKARTIRVMGEDESVRLLRVNDTSFVPNDLVKENIDIAKGRYDTIISTGPAYATRRQEGAQSLMELARGNQTIADRAADIIVRSLDMPLGDELAERLKPQGVGDPDEMTPEEQQQAAQTQQLAQLQAQMEMASAEAKLAKEQAEAKKAEAEAKEADAKAALAELDLMERRKNAALEGAGMAAFAADEREE